MTGANKAQIDQKANIKKALQMAIYLRMTASVEKKTGLKITTD